MSILLKENKKIIANYLSKKTSREYENYTKKVMSIQKDIEKGKNVEKNKAALKKIQEAAKKKWGDDSFQKYILAADKCMKLYRALGKNKEGMSYADYEKLKKYTDVLGNTEMIEKIKNSITDEFKRDPFNFVTFHFREISGIVNNWQKCHGDNLEKAFPMQISDFEQGKYSEVGHDDNGLNWDNLDKYWCDLNGRIGGLIGWRDGDHKDSKEYKNMLDKTDELVGMIRKQFDKRYECEKYPMSSTGISNEIFKSVQITKKAIHDYIEARGGIEDQITILGKMRMGRAMGLYEKILKIENLCITSEARKAYRDVHNAIALKNEPVEKENNVMLPD